MICSSCGKKLKSSNFCKKCKNLEVPCPICGKPITHSNKYGMFCDKECGLADAKAFDTMLDRLAEVIDRD